MGSNNKAAKKRTGNDDEVGARRDLPALLASLCSVTNVTPEHTKSMMFRVARQFTLVGIAVAITSALPSLFHSVREITERR